MLEKTARKPSADPVQEKLRQNKALWNKDVSAFVNDLIHLKKLMNGWPSKFFKERSRIGDPMPADPTTIIGSLAGDFQDIAQRGNALVAEQLEYSKNRRKKQPKAPVAPTTPATPEAPVPSPAPADLTKQLAAWETKYDYQLVAEASNPFTRFFTKLLTPTIGFGEAARIRRLRMTLLKACAKTLKELKKLQNEIVKSGKGSIGESHKIGTEVWNNWSVVARGFAAAKSLKPETPPDSGGDIEIMSPEEKEELMQQQSLGRTTTQYKLRAEAPVDILNFVKSLKDAGHLVQNVRMKNLPLGEQEATFESDANIATIKDILWKQVPDSQVMLDTIAPLSEYTGERTWEAATRAEQTSKPQSQMPQTTEDITATPLYILEDAKKIISDFKSNLYQVNILAQGNPAVNAALAKIHDAIERFLSTPKNTRANTYPDLNTTYTMALNTINSAVGTDAASLRDIVIGLKEKSKAEKAKPSTIASIEAELIAQAQLARWLRKTRHQLLPGGASGSRLEIYNLITDIKRDLNIIMDSLEDGWHPEKLQQVIPQANRQMTSLRALTRTLHYTEGPKPKGKEKGALESFF